MKPVNSCRNAWVFLVFFLPLIGSAQINLGSFQNISDTQGIPSDEQNFINVENNYYTVWNKWGDIAFSKSDDAGENWSNALTVYSAFDYGANYPVLAVSGDVVMIFYYRNTSGSSQIFMVKSDDGGASFGAETEISSSENGAQVPQVVAEEGVVYLVYEERDENYDYQIVFQKSTNLGETWSEPQMLTTSEEASRWCNIDAEEGSVYVTYNEQTGDEYDHLDIFFTKSDDGGDNWTSPENISNNQDYNARLSTKVMDDMVYVASSSKIDGVQSDIRLYRSEDLGETWLEPLQITDNAGNNARPDLWLGQNADNDHRIYIIYGDGSFTGYENAYLKYSLDHGQNWSDKIQISQDTENGGWPQVGGTASDNADELYFVWNRPDEGTLDYEIWGRSGFNEFTALADISGTVINQSADPVDGALISVGTYNA
ncbi:MAG TPA: sialidase family protein, partial [Bacteroidales bacterium]|nr:sialidase family protein [Bacteroidales bacterium]